MSFTICGVHPLLDDPIINCTFDDILAMDDAEFVKYITHMRESFLKVWDAKNMPPRRGWSMEDLEKEFEQLAGYPVREFWTETDNGDSAIQNTQASLGQAVNGFNASAMYKTRINYDLSGNGKSIYDFFADPTLFDRYLPYARRHFLRDSFYLFAQSVLTGDKLPGTSELSPTNGADYVVAFAEQVRPHGEFELLLEPILASKSGNYTGYGGKLQDNKPLRLTFDEMFKLTHEGQYLPKITWRNLKSQHLNDEHVFHIRQYKKGQRLFPPMFRSFRISMCQYAVQFPPLTAKLIYEKYLSHVDTPVVKVWDPSSGWGGRLLGAMAYNRQLPDGSMQHLSYVGCDPNPAFYKNGASVYDAIRDTYNHIRNSGSLFEEGHDAHVYQMGSEDWSVTHPEGDLVFTSPPYFNREKYSEDPNQSSIKFSQYSDWRDGFLAKTLENAWNWLKPARYLLWNIADIKIGNIYLPLEADSRSIAERLGFRYSGTIYMTLANMPGANRVNATGAGTAKHTCMINGKLMKYEPILVFWKPS